jgi:hypothetical protein
VIVQDNGHVESMVAIIVEEAIINVIDPPP